MDDHGCTDFIKCLEWVSESQHVIISPHGRKYPKITTQSCNALMFKAHFLHPCKSAGPKIQLKKGVNLCDHEIVESSSLCTRRKTMKLMKPTQALHAAEFNKKTTLKQ
jgi:hypothetical protein